MPLLITILYVSCLATMFALGILVLVKDAKATPNRTFFFLAVTSVCWMLSLYMGYLLTPANSGAGLLFFRMAYGFSVLPVFGLLAFFYCFPLVSFKISRPVVLAAHFLTLSLFIISVFTPLIERDVYMQGGEIMDVFGPLYFFYLAYFVVFFTAAIVMAAMKIIGSSGIEREKIIYVSSGFFISVLLAILANVILPVFGVFTFEKESVCVALLFFATAAYSVYRRRFFNFSYIFLGFLRLMILFMFFLACVVLLFSLLRLLPEIDVYIALSLSSMAGFFVLVLSARLFPNLYSEEYRQFRKVMAELESRLFDSKTYDDLHDLLRHIFMEKLSLKSVGLFVISGRDDRNNIPSLREDDFTREVARADDAVVTDELRLKRRATRGERLMLQHLMQLKAAICFPLFSQGRMIGLLTLGSKPKEVIFSREEINGFLKMKSSIEVCFMNIVVSSTLREENDLMREIISEKTATLRNANESLEKMIRQQDSFISLTAHEFRTPLTVAMLGLEQLSHVHRKEMSPDILNDVRVSYDQLNKLTYLIDRLLEMRRVEENKVPLVLGKIDLIRLLADTVMNMKLVCAAKGIGISLAKPRFKSLPLTSDRLKLQQVLDNLLQNACKFTPKGGKITVRLKTYRGRGLAAISVEDTGEGIPEKDLGVIFDKFQQGSRYSQGVGIGLYLCRQYMALLGGRISVKSAPGKGSVFTIELPLKTVNTGRK